MIISEERFASGYVTKDGRTIAYDDLGELLRAVEQDPGLKATAYVHDALKGQWLRAEEAVVLKIPGLATPMASGYAAFASEAQAREFTRQLTAQFKSSAATLSSK